MVYYDYELQQNLIRVYNIKSKQDGGKIASIVIQDGGQGWYLLSASYEITTCEIEASGKIRC